MRNAPEILNIIHTRVLNGFRYVDDQEQFGQAEHWQFPVDVNNVTGDCDDFAIACRVLVRDETAHPSRLVICQTETGEWHLVCAVGQWILDNRHYEVKTKEKLERLGYRFWYTSGLNPGEPWKLLEGEK